MTDTEAVDPDPYRPAGEPANPTGAGDPTAGGRQGLAGDADPNSDPNAASIAADEPTDGGPPIPIAGGAPGAEPDEVPVADPGPTEN